MITLPDHGCCSDPRLAGAVPYGDLDAANVATCALRRRWGVRDGDAPGCGAQIAVCHGCGLRTRVRRPGELEAPPCSACGGTVYPGASQVLTDEPPRASVAQVDPERSIVETKATVDTATSRAEKGQPPVKRATAKRARKGPAPSAEPTLPGVK